MRRSLRLLTLLTLMASALCSGKAVAAQEFVAPRSALADSVALTDNGFLADRFAPPRAAFVAAGAFEGMPATTAQVIGAAATAVEPAFTLTIAPATAPAATEPLAHAFSPQAERAPPAA